MLTEKSVKTMAEYIERQKVIDITAETGALETQRRVQALPAADVASVVRCKECEFHTFLGKCKVHSQEPDQYGPGHDVTMAPDDFCSYGKRKQLEE